ncbi:hypothetical protein B0H11DRAFT_1958682 [Mycena galericulata]|nr:hypothetical protein B0H11DRAFT_1958682 [Mycena galericulata]
MFAQHSLSSMFVDTGPKTNVLHTSDLTAISHIVARPAVFQKSPFDPYSIKRLMGCGILSAELDDRKRQRKILNPAFGVAQIRQMTEVFVEKAIKLRDIWIPAAIQAKKKADPSGGSTYRRPLPLYRAYGLTYSPSLPVCRC